jgi:hypothetical protein
VWSVLILHRTGIRAVCLWIWQLTFLFHKDEKCLDQLSDHRVLEEDWLSSIKLIFQFKFYVQWISTWKLNQLWSELLPICYTLFYAISRSVVVDRLDKLRFDLHVMYTLPCTDTDYETVFSGISCVLPHIELDLNPLILCRTNSSKVCGIWGRQVSDHYVYDIGLLVSFLLY